MTTRKGGPPKGYKQSASHKRKKSKAATGKKNPQYKDGRRSYRRIAGAKEGEVTHHKDGDRTNNKKSNLINLKAKKKGAKTTSKHEKLTKRGQGRKKGSKNKK